MSIIIKNSAISSSNSNLLFNVDNINFLANGYEFSGSINISESLNLSKNYYNSPRIGSILITSSLNNNLDSGSLIFNKNINSLTFNTSNNTSSMSMGGLLCLYQGNNNVEINTTNALFNNILSSSYNTNSIGNYVLNKKNYVFEWDFFEKGKELEIFLHFNNKKNEDTTINSYNSRLSGLDTDLHKLYFVSKGNTSNTSSLFVSNNGGTNNFYIDIFPSADNYIVNFFTDLKFKLICTKKDINNVYFNVITEYLIYHNKADASVKKNSLYNSFCFNKGLYIPKTHFPGYFDFNFNIDTLLYHDSTIINNIFSYFLVN